MTWTGVGGGEQSMAERYVGKEAELNKELMDKHNADLSYPTRVSRRLQCQPLPLTLRAAHCPAPPPPPPPPSPSRRHSLLLHAVQA